MSLEAQLKSICCRARRGPTCADASPSLRAGPTSLRPRPYRPCHRWHRVWLPLTPHTTPRTPDCRAARRPWHRSCPSSPRSPPRTPRRTPPQVHVCAFPSMPHRSRALTKPVAVGCHFSYSFGTQRPRWSSTGARGPCSRRHGALRRRASGQPRRLSRTMPRESSSRYGINGIYLERTLSQLVAC